MFTRLGLKNVKSHTRYFYGWHKILPKIGLK